jgi:hypothetical protein
MTPALMLAAISCGLIAPDSRRSCYMAAMTFTCNRGYRQTERDSPWRFLVDKVDLRSGSISSHRCSAIASRAVPIRRGNPTVTAPRFQQQCHQIVTGPLPTEAGPWIMAVDATRYPLEAGSPMHLFTGGYDWNYPGLPNYDVARDGTRFVMVSR